MPKSPESTGQKDQPDYTAFFSTDPYAVLGLPKTASDEDIKKNKRHFQIRFHPDKNKDPRALEISKRINTAYDAIIKEREGGVPKNNQPPQPETSNDFGRARGNTQEGSRANAESGPDFGSARKESSSDDSPEDQAYDNKAGPKPRGRKHKPESAEKMESNFLFELKYGLKSFTEYLANAKTAGVKSERLKEMLNTEQAREAIKNTFILNLEIRIDDAESCIEYIDGWTAIGVDVKKFLTLPKIKTALSDEVIKKVRIFGRDNPDNFLKYVGEWRKVGINLGEMVNSEEVNQLLTSYTRNKNPDEFKAYVKGWVDAGWKPSAKIMNALSLKESGIDKETGTLSRIRNFFGF